MKAKIENTVVSFGMVVVVSMLVFAVCETGCPGAKSEADLVDKLELACNGYRNEISVLTFKLNKQEALNDSLKNEIKELKIDGDGDFSKWSVTNNVWPWMILAIVELFLFLTYLYFSKHWKGRRGAL